MSESALCGQEAHVPKSRITIVVVAVAGLVLGAAASAAYTLGQRHEGPPAIAADGAAEPTLAPRYVLTCELGGGEFLAAPLLGPEPNDAELGDVPPGARCAAWDLVQVSGGALGIHVAGGAEDERR